MRFLLSLLLVLTLATVSHGRELTVATWNLGWHVDRTTAPDWIAACNATYAQENGSGPWKPSTAANAKKGWDIDVFQVENWDTARFPVCNVYRTSSNRVVQFTAASYEKRLTQVRNFIASNLQQADVIAFEEVSGKQAVADVLPSPDEFTLCDYPGFKVQRLVIAWRKSLGTEVACTPEPSLSLPANEARLQPRPGLSLTLNIDGKKVSFLAVHLKSSCVSPFERDQLIEKPGRDNEACTVLRQQVAPLEAWVERVSSQSDHVVFLGDFNRNFWHEAKDSASVRADNGSPVGPLPTTTPVNSLLEEIADGHPVKTPLTLLPEHCGVNLIAKTLCEAGDERLLTFEEVDLLGSVDYLGCRNPIGLDHIVLGPGVTSYFGATHVPIGVFGSSKAARDDLEALLAISDHCPLMAKLLFASAPPTQ